MEPTTFLLTNTYWSSVTAIIQKGNNGNCDLNSYLTTVTLQQNQTQVITTYEENICWKRDSNPDGHYTNWHMETVELFGDRQRVVDLN